MKKDYKYIYGPVPSWRLGSSLGIDLLSQESKICSFDCVYCQLGGTSSYTSDRKSYVFAEECVEELKILPETQIDYITFSGRGEPTLAENLGEMIITVKNTRKEPIAVLTNSSTMARDDVRRELGLADFVIAKLDTYSRDSFKGINGPAQEIEFSSVLSGLKQFRKEYRGRLALQVMFIEQNKDGVAELAYLTNFIRPDEIQINTPLRPCAVKPLSKNEIFKIKEYFCTKCGSALSGKKIKVVSVYDEKKHKRETFPISAEDTLKRRGKLR